MSETSREYRRANSLANWSYVGILIPVLGMAFGYISRSIIRGLPQPEAYGIMVRFKSVYTKALWGLVVSWAFFILSTASSGFGWYALNHQLAAQKKASDAQIAESDARYKESLNVNGNLVLENMNLKEQNEKLVNDYSNLRDTVLRLYR